MLSIVNHEFLMGAFQFLGEFFSANGGLPNLPLACRIRQAGTSKFSQNLKCTLFNEFRV